MIQGRALMEELIFYNPQSFSLIFYDFTLSCATKKFWHYLGNGVTICCCYYAVNILSYIIGKVAIML